LQHGKDISKDLNPEETELSLVAKGLHKCNSSYREDSSNKDGSRHRGKRVELMQELSKLPNPE
jgi:hypothetical protein